MNNDQKSLEVKVGFFVFIGLVVIAMMAVQFGRLGQGLQKTYPLTVQFPNAGGLLKNSDVLLAGAAVGHVVEKPYIVDGEIGSVIVPIRIREGIAIPRGSTFQIGSSGLMGDKSVSITPPADFNPATFNPNDPKMAYQPGDKVIGTEGGGIEALARKGEEAMVKVSESLDEFKKALEKLHQGVLSDENIKNLQDAIASVKTTGDNFAVASGKLDGIVSGAGEVVDSAKKTMETANAAATDIRSAVGDAREAIKSAQAILKNAQTGNGALPTLLNNPELADNLKALIANLRRHGVLFYRDSSNKAQPPSSSPAVVPGRAGRR